MVGEHNGESCGLFTTSAARTPYSKVSVCSPFDNLAENRVHERLELGLSAKEIGFFDSDLAENMPPLF